jgi:hypothetical protein
LYFYPLANDKTSISLQFQSFCQKFETEVGSNSRPTVLPHKRRLHHFVKWRARWIEKCAKSFHQHFVTSPITIPSSWWKITPQHPEPVVRLVQATPIARL